MYGFENKIAHLASLRKKHGEFLELVEQVVDQRLALVLVQPPPLDFQVDYVINSPALNEKVLFGRYEPESMSLDRIQDRFPERTIYLFREEEWQLTRVSLGP